MNNEESKRSQCEGCGKIADDDDKTPRTFWAALPVRSAGAVTLTLRVLTDILTFAGKYAGLCDWRPSSPKSPGPFGKFTATVTEVK